MSKDSIFKGEWLGVVWQLWGANCILLQELKGVQCVGWVCVCVYVRGKGQEGTVVCMESLGDTQRDLNFVL